MTRKLPASKSDPGLLFQKLREQIFIDLHIVAFDLIYRLLIAIARKTGTKNDRHVRALNILCRFIIFWNI